MDDEKKVNDIDSLKITALKEKEQTLDEKLPRADFFLGFGQSLSCRRRFEADRDAVGRDTGRLPDRGHGGRNPNEEEKRRTGHETLFLTPPRKAQESR